jgi:hypothetical protein
MTPLKTGEPVIITYEGKTVQGFVRLASPNGAAAVLAFEAILGGFVGLLAVSIDDDGSATDLIFNRPVTITPTRYFAS